MFPKEDIKIPDNNIEGIIKVETEEFDTSSDDGLFKIKYEFEEENTKIHYGVLENQLTEKSDDLLSFDGESSKSALKIESTINVMFSKKAIKIEDDEIKSENTEKYYEINTCLDSSNIKCEFEEEETKIQYGVFENQLHEDNFDKSTIDIPKLRILDGQFTKNFQKTEGPISNMFSKEDIESARSQKTDSTIFSNKKSHICEFCDKCFNALLLLNIHQAICRAGHYKSKISAKNISQQNTQTKEILYMCEICNKCFTRTENFNVHMKIHTEDKSYKCETCDKCFATKPHLNIHMKFHTGEKTYKCETSGKCFTQKGHLKEHSGAHTEEDPYKCEICGKCFTVKGDLNRHNRTHTKKKLYKCKTCSTCFAEKEALNVHIRTHPGYMCHTCGKCFKRKSILKWHNTTHSGEEPYKCEICGKCFTQRGHLKEHIRTHSGEKPYKCEICGKCFVVKRGLNRHNGTHTKKKLYKCKTCSTCFAEKEALNVHIRTHPGYLCYTCDKFFKLKSRLNRHIQLTHQRSPINARHVANALN